MKLFEYELEEWRCTGDNNHYRACLDMGFYIGLTSVPNGHEFKMFGHLNGKELDSDSMIIRFNDLYKEIYGNKTYYDLEQAKLEIDAIINRANNLKVFL